MSLLTEYVSGELQAAVDASSVSDCVVSPWYQEQPPGWAVCWAPVSVDLSGDLARASKTYQIEVAVFGLLGDPDEFAKQCIDAYESDGLMANIAEINWDWGPWEFGQHNPDDSGLMLGALAQATIPSLSLEVG